MEVSPAAGKIIGMLMAYVVSAFGLLLAYYNYRKRIIKADRIFTTAAKTVIIGVVTIAVVGSVLTAAAVSGEGSWWDSVKGNLFGLVVPAAIVLVSVWLTWLLYRHFSSTLHGGE